MTRPIPLWMWLVACVTLGSAGWVCGAEGERAGAGFDGWQPRSPRDEIAPRFEHVAAARGKGTGALVIHFSSREGEHGWFEQSFPVTGGTWYHLVARHTTERVAIPRRSAYVRVHWRDEKGKPVHSDPPTDSLLTRGPTAQPEYPGDAPADATGVTTVEGTYQAPSQARQAIVELHGRWAPNGRVAWHDTSFREAPPVASRKVRLASVHFKPSGGKSPLDNCRQYEPYIAEAAGQKADLVVLGETITYVGLGKTYAEVAEPVPGPSTAYFGEVAKKHALHIVVGLLERDAERVYNVAVLIDPEGKLIGKYRKVCLPRGEVDGGIMAGRDFPVFETRFGKVGMMVCYDGFFPEVARQLSANGAEVIAFPVWGCNPLLAAARACENHVYVVSSTFTDHTSNWMKTAVYGHDGKALAEANAWGSVVVAEVDLSRRHFWNNNLGDFRAQVHRERPVVASDRPVRTPDRVPRSNTTTEPNRTAAPTSSTPTATGGERTSGSRSSTQPPSETSSRPVVAAPVAPRNKETKPKMRTVACLLFEGVELMDFTGPAEVFIVASRGEAFRVVTVAESTQPLKTMGGITITPDFSYATAPDADILIVPGGNMRSVNAAGRAWVKKAAAKAEITMSVCYGALLLAEVGLLDQRQATTHHWAIDDLKQLAPTCKVVEGERFVDNGPVLTTAGVTAGIDGALHIVKRLLGEDRARWTAEEWMEHRPREKKSTSAKIE